jgi:predicted nucleic acid-binding protein
MLTFLDSNVLIAAATGSGKHAPQAVSILNDPIRTFASSPFVRLETLPKAVFHKQKQEVAFYEAYFQSVNNWIADCEAMVKEAEKVGCQFGLNMGDALHIAAALMAKADEFITAERPASPFKNVMVITVVSIYTS